ncbi:MAG: protein kinase [Parachlamydiales bacterium]|jgi:serine/threonine protein kinase
MTVDFFPSFLEVERYSRPEFFQPQQAEALSEVAFLSISEFAVFYRARLNGELVALKIFIKSQGFFERELKSLASVQDVPGVLPLLGRAFFRENCVDKCVLITKFIEGQDLFFFKGSAANRSFLKVSRISLQVLRILDCLHKNKILHADIKPGNIMVSPNGRVTLVDFGLSYEYVGPDGEIKKEIYGTWPYLPPLFPDSRSKEKGPSIDMWGLGCTIFEICTGQNFSRLRSCAYTQEDYDQIVERWVKDEKLARLIKSLLVFDPEKRLTARQALQEWKAYLNFFENPEAYTEALKQLFQEEPSTALEKKAPPVNLERGLVSGWDKKAFLQKLMVLLFLGYLVKFAGQF